MIKFENEFTDDEAEKINEEYKRTGNQIYLDHAGTTLYSERQIDDVTKMLKDNLFCNPHTCKITVDLIDQVRSKILQHFNSNYNEYDIVFTSGTTASLKTVAECFHFGTQGSFYYCQENHTSVLGMRGVVQTNNISVLNVDEILENLSFNEKLKEISICENHSLLVFSAQCNLSGYKMPLEIIDSVQKCGLKNSGHFICGQKPIATNDFYVCLDAASFVATNYLDLGRYKPDFVCLSFYKLFGYPTGLGALIVSRRGQALLKKRYYGGGTVQIAMSRMDMHEKRTGFSEKFEDGTLSFLSICALLEGFRTVERLIPTIDEFDKFKIVNRMERISKHVFNLAKYCFNSMKNLKHENGQNLIEFYKKSDFDSRNKQGGIICFNLKHDNGEYIGFAEIACIAAIHNVILRTGCFCNPGGCQNFLRLSDEDLKRHFKSGHICSDYNDLVDGQPTGAVRLSFGYMTTKGNIDSVLKMFKTCYIKETKTVRLKKLLNAKLPKILSHIPNRLNDFDLKINSEKICLKNIFIYPIKSCGRFEISNGSWELTENGLKYDRNWMIVDSNGVAVTQKSTSLLSIISPRISNNELILHFPNMDAISIPIKIESTQKTFNTTICQSKVCGDIIEGFDCGQKISTWLESALGIPGLRLIKQNVNRQRKDGAEKKLNLSNQAQFLLINKTSVEWLIEKIPEDDFDLDRSDLNGILARFRGNLIIETNKPLEENNFEKLTIGNTEFFVDGPCTRCQMICIDQNTGEKTVEPLKTIAKEFKGKIKFGVYLSQKSDFKNDKPRLISCYDDIKA